MLHSKKTILGGLKKQTQGAECRPKADWIVKQKSQLEGGAPPPQGPLCDLHFTADPFVFNIHNVPAQANKLSTEYSSSSCQKLIYFLAALGECTHSLDYKSNSKYVKLIWLDCWKKQGYSKYSFQQTPCQVFPFLSTFFSVWGILGCWCLKSIWCSGFLKLFNS